MADHENGRAKSRANPRERSKSWFGVVVVPVVGIPAEVEVRDEMEGQMWEGKRGEEVWRDRDKRQSREKKKAASS